MLNGFTLNGHPIDGVGEEVAVVYASSGLLFPMLAQATVPVVAVTPPLRGSVPGEVRRPQVRVTRLPAQLVVAESAWSTWYVHDAKVYRGPPPDVEAVDDDLLVLMLA